MRSRFWEKDESVRTETALGAHGSFIELADAWKKGCIKLLNAIECSHSDIIGRDRLFEIAKDVRQRTVDQAEAPACHLVCGRSSDIPFSDEPFAERLFNRLRAFAGVGKDTPISSVYRTQEHRAFLYLHAAELYLYALLGEPEDSRPLSVEQLAIVDNGASIVKPSGDVRDMRSSFDTDYWFAFIRDHWIPRLVYHESTQCFSSSSLMNYISEAYRTRFADDDLITKDQKHIRWRCRVSSALRKLVSIGYLSLTPGVSRHYTIGLGGPPIAGAPKPLSSF